MFFGSCSECFCSSGCSCLFAISDSPEQLQCIGSIRPCIQTRQTAKQHGCQRAMQQQGQLGFRSGRDSGLALRAALRSGRDSGRISGRINALVGALQLARYSGRVRGCVSGRVTGPQPWEHAWNLGAAWSMLFPLAQTRFSRSLSLRVVPKRPPNTLAHKLHCCKMHVLPFGRAGHP